MKIIITAYYVSELGGGETSMINLINYLVQDNKNEVTVVVPSFGAFVECISSKVVVLVASKYFDLIRLRGEYDLAIHNYINYGKKFLFLPFLRVKMHKFICHGEWDVPRYTKLYLLKVKGSELLCVNTQLYNSINYGKKRKINLGVEVKQYDVVKNRGNSLNIGVIGRFQDIKNQMFAIDVFIDCNRQNFKLFIIGDEAFTEESRKYKRLVYEKIKKFDNDRIFLMGAKKPSKVFDEIDVVFVPSKYESFGMVVIEALVNGIICVAPNIGGPKEIMSDVLSEYLYEVGDRKGARDILENVASNLIVHQEKFINLAPNFVQKYEISNVANSLTE